MNGFQSIAASLLLIEACTRPPVSAPPLAEISVVNCVNGNAGKDCYTAGIRVDGTLFVSIESSARPPTLCTYGKNLELTQRLNERQRAIGKTQKFDSEATAEIYAAISKRGGQEHCSAIIQSGAN